MNQRRRTRVVSRKGVTLVWTGGQAEGAIDNVSLKGCLVALGQGQPPPPAPTVRVAIHLEEGSPELDVSLEARVVRADPAAVALDFIEVPPESFHHLFRLVQYNAEDPDGIEAELGSSAFEGAARDPA